MVGLLLAGALVAFAEEPANVTYEAPGPTLIGEPVWIAVTVPEGAERTVARHLDPGRLDQRASLDLRVTGPDGAPVYDPWNAPLRDTLFPHFRAARVVLDAQGRPAFDLNRYAWLDQPGTYQVVVTGPPGFETAAPLSLLMVAPTPDQAVEVVQSRPINHEQADLSVRQDLYEGLGHPVYVPILEPLARASRPRERRGPQGRTIGPDLIDHRALRGLDTCPCPEATDALLRLFNAFEDPEVQRFVAAALTRRMPDDLRSDTEDLPPQFAAHNARHNEFAVRRNAFIDRAWASRHNELALQRARAILTATSFDSGWGWRVEWAADTVRRLGTDQDVPPLLAGLRHVLAAPAESRTASQAFGAGSMVDWALQRFDNLQTDDPTVQAWIDLHARRPGAPPPADWEDRLLAAFTSRSPRLTYLALRRIDGPPSDRLVPWIRASLDHDDDWVHEAAAHVALEWPHMAYWPTLRDQLAHGPIQAHGPPDAFDVAGALPLPWRDRYRLLVARLGPGEPNGAIVSALLEPFADCTSRAAGGTVPDVPAMKTAWTAFLDRQGPELDPELRMGPGFPTELAPDGYRCERDGAQIWP